MRYVALLRAVNVGGANKVSVAYLKSVFEAAGMKAVQTYINSGNVIFSTDLTDRSKLIELLREALRRRAFLDVDLQLRDADEMGAIVEALPPEWTNDATMKCDVLFLQPDVDRPGLLEELGPRPGIEDALYVPGAVIWRIDRTNATRSRLTRMVGTPLYSRLTVRNINTTRKLYELLQSREPDVQAADRRSPAPPRPVTRPRPPATSGSRRPGPRPPGAPPGRAPRSGR